MEVLIKDELTLNITLKNAEQKAMDEIVVTALGSQKKVTVTGAITTVDLTTLKTPTSSITNALAGNVAGVLAMQGAVSRVVMPRSSGSGDLYFWSRYRRAGNGGWL